MGIPDTCIEAIVFPLLSIVEDVYKGFHIGIFFEVTKELQHKEAGRIIGKSRGFIFMGNDGSNKSKIHEGRDESREPTDDTSIGMDLDVTVSIGIF